MESPGAFSSQSSRNKENAPLKNVLYFLKKKLSLYFNEWNFLASRSKKFSRELSYPKIENFLIFWEMELSGPKIKNFFIFSQRKIFLIFQKMELSSPKSKQVSQENFTSSKIFLKKYS